MMLEFSSLYLPSPKEVADTLGFEKLSIRNVYWKLEEYEGALGFSEQGFRKVINRTSAKSLDSKVSSVLFKSLIYKGISRIKRARRLVQMRRSVRVMSNSAHWQCVLDGMKQSSMNLDSPMTKFMASRADMDYSFMCKVKEAVLSNKVDPYNDREVLDFQRSLWVEQGLVDDKQYRFLLGGLYGPSESQNLTNDMNIALFQMKLDFYMHLLAHAEVQLQLDASLGSRDNPRYTPMQQAIALYVKGDHPSLFAASLDVYRNELSKVGEVNKMKLSSFIPSTSKAIDEDLSEAKRNQLNKWYKGKRKNLPSESTLEIFIVESGGGDVHRPYTMLPMLGLRAQRLLTELEQQQSSGESESGIVSNALQGAISRYPLYVQRAFSDIKRA